LDKKNYPNHLDLKNGENISDFKMAQIPLIENGANMLDFEIPQVLWILI
jgi:hypothetical protein